MRIEGIHTLDGPNLYHDKPVLLMLLHLGDLTERESRELPGFHDRLLELLPGLRQHHCSPGHEGGFVERLERGTYFGHVTEHVALEMASSLGSPVTYGKTRYGGERGFYHVIVRYRSEHGMRALLRSAVALVDALVEGEPFPLEQHLHEAAELAADTDLGPSTLAIVRAAERLGIPWRRLNEASLVQLGHGRHRRLIQAALTDGSGHIAVDTASDKERTKQLLREVGIPVPDGRVARSVDEALEALESLGGPVVVKPLDGNQGKGVTLHVNEPAELAKAYEEAHVHADRVLVERQLSGRNYRLLVVNGRVVAASERRPCQVMGDGERSIAELIELANADERRGDGHEKPLTKILVDEGLKDQLRRSGFGLDDSPAEGQAVILRSCANLSTGATAVDVTDHVHPQTRRACERAALTIGLDICGVDLITSDIAEAMDGGIIELNAAPGLRMHLAPEQGPARDVGTPIVEMLFPDGATSRVPIVSVTGTNGKTTVTRMIGHVLSGAGMHVGMTTSDGIVVDGERIARGDCTGQASARTVLGHPEVEAAVLETARGGILRRGLGYDWADVAVVTNITPDHIGQDGIEDLSDLVWIKSLVAERVRDGGTLVLNADDANAAGLAAAERVDVKRLDLVYFAVNPKNPVVMAHVQNGGTAYYVRSGWIVEALGSEERPIADLTDLPLTLGGYALFQVSNCLAAVAASRALGCSPGHVGIALGTFRSTAHNPGRANFYRHGQGYVMVDYGHNPEAFRAAAGLVSAWRGPLAAIVAVPGDRSDALIEEAARAVVSGFDQVIVREDRDLRGRRSGEVAEIMLRTMREEAPGIDCAFLEEGCTALRRLMPEVAIGTMVVIFADDVQEIVDQLSAAGAQAVEAHEVFSFGAGVTESPLYGLPVSLRGTAPSALPVRSATSDLRWRDAR